MVRHCTLPYLIDELLTFYSGSNVARAIPFFDRLTTSLLNNFLESEGSESVLDLSGHISACLRALGKLLKRELKIAYHDDLLL